MLSTKSISRLAVLIAVVASIYLLGVSWWGSIVLVCVLFAMTWFGKMLLARLTSVEFGFAVSAITGGGVFVFFSQIQLIAGVSHHYAYWLSLSALIASAIYLDVSSRVVETRTAGTTADVYLALSIGLVAMGVSHYWLLPFGLGLIFAERILRKRETVTAFKITAIGLAVGGWLVAHAMRPDRWWQYYQGHSSQYHEALSWSTGWWGIFEQPGYFGGTVANYHWFSFAFWGSLSSIASLPPYFVLTRVAILLIPCLFASLFVWQPRRFPEGFSIRWIMILLAVIAMDTNRTESVTFGLLVAIALFTVVREIVDLRTTYRQGIILCLLSLMLFLSKVPVAVVTGISLAILALTQLLSRKRLTWLPPLALLSVAALYSITFMSDNEPEMWGRFNFGLAATLTELADFLEPRSALNFFVWATGLAVIFSQRRLRTVPVIHYAVLIAALMALSAHLIFPGQHTRYFGVTGISLVTLYSVWNFDEVFSGLKQRMTKTQTLVLTAVFTGSFFSGYRSPELLRGLEPSLEFDGVIGTFFKNLIVGSGLTFGLLAITPIAYLVFRKRLTVVLLATAVLGALAGQTVEYYRQLRTWGPEIYEATEPMYGVFGQNDLRALSAFIQDTTDEKAVLASNQFCCVGEEWAEPGRFEFESLFLKGPNGEQGQVNQARFGGHDYMLPAHVRRRFLAQGLRLYLLLRDESLSREEPMRRLRLSLEFANRPSSRSLEELRSLGVSGFVVNLSLTEQRDWSRFADEKFRMGNYVYLDLT